jgi:D-cysteine desulfhydrase
LLGQFAAMAMTPDHIVLGSGSSGTHAGLVTGLFAHGADIPVLGIGVSRDPADQDPLVLAETRASARLLGLPADVPRERIASDGGFWRPGYSLPNARMVEAVQLLARLEGIPLDPTYTGKAMAGLIDKVRAGVFRKGQNIVFLHTGGLPALFTANDVLLGRLAPA